MKLFILSTLVISLAVQSFAAESKSVCKDTALVVAARKLDLRGKVSITANDQTSLDTAEALSKDSEDYKDLVRALNEDSEILSQVFSLKSAEVMGAVIRNVKTCALSLAGAQGAGEVSSEILEITKSSIKIRLGETALIEVKKLSGTN